MKIGNNNLHTVLIAKSNTKGFELVINSGGEVDEFKKQYGNKIQELLATSEEVLALRRLPYRDAVELVKTILKNPDVNERPKININSIRSHVDTIPSFEKDIIDLQL